MGAHSLSGDSLRYLRDDMLDECWHPMPIDYDFYEHLDEIRDDDAVYDGSGVHPLHNISFAAQMESIFGVASRRTQYPHPKLAFFLTMKSALPIAQSLHGFHDTLGIERPVIEPITTYSRKRDVEGENLTVLKLVHKEVSRIETILEQQKPEAVVVVDQYVCSGKTLQLANNILHMAGVSQESIYNIAGHWYGDFHPADESRPADILTADPSHDPLAARFYMVGSLAARTMSGIVQT